MKRVILLSGLFLSSLSLAGASDVLQGNWKMVGWTLPDAVPVKQHLPTFRFENGKLSGFGGCNQFSGGYTLQGQQLNISSLASTRKACTEAINQQEKALLKALSTPLKAERKADSLTLTLSDGSMLNIRRSTLQKKGK